MVRDERGRVLFVRHTYGDRRAWELPGGNLRRREDPATAIRREMREELGIDLQALREVVRVEATGYGKRTLLHGFEARTGGAPVQLERAEIAEARWAAPAAPPQPVGRHTRALLEAVRRVGGGH